MSGGGCRDGVAYEPLTVEAQLRIWTGATVAHTSKQQAAPPDEAVNGTISALVDGVAWRGAVSARATKSGNILNITGQDTDMRIITMVVLAVAPGTYSLNFGNPSNVYMASAGQQWSTVLPGGLGDITVTTFTTTRVAGTFTLTMQPSQSNTVLRPSQVTNGRFDLAF